MVRARQLLTRLAGVITITTGCGYVYFRTTDDMYAGPIGTLIQSLDTERAHRLGVLAARYRLAGLIAHDDVKSKGKGGDGDDVLKMKVWGKVFDNPIGLAAGFDKDAEAVQGMLEVGFGFVEVGSVTPVAQPGNEKPRVFRLKEDRGIINRYGFNSKGIEFMEDQLKRLRGGDVSVDGIVGVNLGKNKSTREENAVDDYVMGVERLGKYADYIVVNVSSPNTPGLRKLQGKEKLRKILEPVLAARSRLVDKPPVILKISPDLSEEDKHDIAELSMELKIDGLIVTNTTIGRKGLKSELAAEAGGLSGRPLKDLSTQVLRDMYRLTDGSIPLIGVGGVESANDAYEKLKAGATLVQLYSALIYEGPALVPRIKRNLKALILQDGYRSAAEVVGADHKK